jgi:hypothetical protein
MYVLLQQLLYYNFNFVPFGIITQKGENATESCYAYTSQFVSFQKTIIPGEAISRNTRGITKTRPHETASNLSHGPKSSTLVSSALDCQYVVEYLM